MVDCGGVFIQTSLYGGGYEERQLMVLLVLDREADVDKLQDDLDGFHDDMFVKSDS